ncbi:MAG: TonB-dependent receptor plug domain-containing protein [Gammaproteobacteria bacterium]|nr:TonB-dependent receptor plug domain-containing protein [Gammaproteobacteria bacterium]
MPIQHRMVRSWVLAIAVLALPFSLFAQEEDETDTDATVDATAIEDAEDIEELTVLGSRSLTPRTVEDSTAPIDFFSGEELLTIGNAADITDALRANVPYFNASMASGDGDTFVRPTSLRGLAPDQHLVMINGKRRHRAALIAEFVPAAGKGAHGPNIGMIPSIAIDNVQILRDGASAQYGSDAISGVINFQMRDDDSGVTFRSQYGTFYDGETAYKIEGNVGLKFGPDGFFNVSFESTYNEGHSRGQERFDAQALKDSGVPFVGFDSPFRDRLAQTWGRPQTQNLLIFWNAGRPFVKNTSLYSFGNISHTTGRYRFFYRNPNHATLAALSELGFTGLPWGFTPYFDGETDDYSIVVGWKGTYGRNVNFDLSSSVGRNMIDFTLNNTINQSIGLNDNNVPRQRDFDVGALKQYEWNVNADFGRPWINDMYLAYGMEWRLEVFTIFPGEAVSYEGVGASGFRGLHPVDSGKFDRQNYGLYAELEKEREKLLWQFATRFEAYEDFGLTLNGKLAFRYKFEERITGRAAVSTGFHAPTPGQINIQKVTTTFDTNVGGEVAQGLVKSDSPLAAAAGGKPLQEETSINYSVGAVVDLEEIFESAQVSIDVYVIDVKDRIYKTQTLPAEEPATGAQTNISFYTNALDVQSRGFDIVYSVPFVYQEYESDLSLAISHNTVEVEGQSLVNGIAPVPLADIEDIENSYPKLKISFSSTTYLSDKWELIIRSQYYGRHYDERGRIGGSPPTKELDASIYFDLITKYQINDIMSFEFGAINLFHNFVDTIGEPYANRLDVGLPYARRTAANFEGGSIYATFGLSW